MSVEQIQGLADGLAARLGRAVLVDDRELRLVAASADFGDADPARVWSLLHRKTRPEDVQHEEIARLPGPGYVPANPALELWQRLCVPVRCRGLLLGFLWITDRFGDLTPEQVAEAAGTATEIGVLLHGRLRAGDRDRERMQDLVEQLLSQDAATRSEARDEAVDRGLLDDDVPAAVVLIRHSPGNEDGSAAFGADVERFFLHQSGMRALTAAWPRRATVIVTGRATQQGEWLGRSVRALLGELGEAGSWRVAAGGPVAGLAELPAAKRQADIALSTVGDGGAACWPELSADALLAQFPHQAWADVLLPEGAARLLADPAAATLLPTLGTFLDCAGDVQRAAAELRVHRATLYNRLSRIEQISGLNLRDGRDRLLMHLALRLHHMYGAPQRPVLATDDEGRPRNPRRRAG
jgi:PucR C-terminal helix-turn-helix domain/GGDEF-like domain